MAIERAVLIRKALFLEYLTIAWNVMEGIVAIVAGVVARSIALVSFGLDSLIEVISAVTLIWRLKKSEPDEETERIARKLAVIKTIIHRSNSFSYDLSVAFWDWTEPISSERGRNN